MMSMLASENYRDIASLWLAETPETVIAFAYFHTSE